MLSSPAVRVRGRDEAVGRGRGIAVRLEEHRRDLVLGEHVSEAVGAEEDEVAECGHGEDVHLDGALGSDRSRDRRALWMPLRLLGGEDAALHELRDERVVGRDLLEPVTSQPIGAGVAHMSELVSPRRRMRR